MVQLPQCQKALYLIWTWVNNTRVMACDISDWYQHDTHFASFSPAHVHFLVSLPDPYPANLVTAVQHDPILVEIFIFISQEISAKLEKILPICRNLVQSLVGCY